MTLQDALATLRRHESALRERGVAHAAVFGSVVRGDDRPDSDVDIWWNLSRGPKGQFTITCASKTTSPAFSRDRLT
jgi:predicted nucleotidyltransferase